MACSGERGVLFGLTKQGAEEQLTLERTLRIKLGVGKYHK